ncbi:Sjogren's syndrome/scleroderma autoantigen 1 family protein [Methanofollis aquaemaris]|nr:Sjogren's syndrome/scleroderma autoantigen 1 family protein [Methanofollis aquaemaris]
MAEYLLKGGKMLAKECKACGSPMFEYKGETLCVVCAERTVRQEREPPAPMPAAPAAPPARAGTAEAGIEAAVTALCTRVEGENDERRCLTLMQAVLAGAEALKILRHS